ncbi:MAG: hypothetical protein RIR18_934 [Pseudomonadota bacterium]|jgi:hypothetical protein
MKQTLYAILVIALAGCSYIPTRTEWIKDRAPWKSNTELCEDVAHGGVLGDVANAELGRRDLCCDDITRKAFKGPGPANTWQPRY